MKYLLLLIGLGVLFFVLGARRGRPSESEARKPPPPAQEVT